MDNLEEKINGKFLERIEGLINNDSISPEQARDILKEIFAIREVLITSEKNSKNPSEEDSPAYLEKRSERSWKSLQDYVEKGTYSKEETEMIFEKMYGRKPEIL